MPSQDKLIKQGINYTDSLFGELSKRLEAGVRSTDTLEAFLDATKEFTAKNPLISSGYDETMLRLILQETNNHRFSRPSQKELVRVTIEENVGDLIVDVGEDIKESVREIVKDGYNQNLSQDEIAANISNRVSVIKNTRARTIARTEIARTATVSDYIINKERGATHFYVECRNTACPVCKEAWHTGWTIENDNTYSPSDSSAGGKGWIGDKVYSMNDTKMLPPIHPNCRCVAYFVAEDEIPKGATIVKETPTTTTTTEIQSVESNNNLLGDGTYKKYSETTEHGRELDVYKFENMEIGIEKGCEFTFEDMVDHLNNLPKEFVENTYATRINIAATKNLESEHAYGEGNVAGFYAVEKGEVYVFEANQRTKEYIKDVFNHEYSHSRDLNHERKNTLADPKIYEKYVQADNVYGISNPTDLDRLTYKAPTEYAGRSYLREKNGPTPEARYTEDIADSAKAYLNPHTHSEFVKNFPNRTKYFEEVYGKPNFNKINYSTSGFEGEKTTRVRAEQDVAKLETQYKTKLYDITTQLEELKIKRREYREKSYENEDEYDKWNNKYREARVEMKRLKQVKQELDGELYLISRAKENV